MGMFDRVIAYCPKCDSKVEFQSKAGPCTLRTYFLYEVPIDIAKSLNGSRVDCENCGQSVGIEISPTVPDSVKMRLTN